MIDTPAFVRNGHLDVLATNALGRGAVTTRRIGHAAGQRVDVPVCAPCAVAGVTPAQG